MRVPQREQRGGIGAPAQELHRGLGRAGHRRQVQGTVPVDVSRQRVRAGVEKLPHDGQDRQLLPLAHRLGADVLLRRVVFHHERHHERRPSPVVRNVDPIANRLGILRVFHQMFHAPSPRVAPVASRLGVDRPSPRPHGVQRRAHRGDVPASRSVHQGRLAAVVALARVGSGGVQVRECRDASLAGCTSLASCVPRFPLSAVRGRFDGAVEGVEGAPEDVVARLVPSVDVRQGTGLDDASNPRQVLRAVGQSQPQHDEHPRFVAVAERADARSPGFAHDGVEVGRGQAAELRLLARRDGGVGVSRRVPRERQADHHLLEQRGLGGADVDPQRRRREIRRPRVLAELEGALSGVGEEREERALRGGHGHRLAQRVGPQRALPLLVRLQRRREIARPERRVPGGARVVGGDERGARGRELVRARHGALDVFVDIAFEGRSIHALGRRRQTRGGGECVGATQAECLPSSGEATRAENKS